MTLLSPLFNYDFLMLACLASTVLVVIGEMFRGAPTGNKKAPDVKGSAIAAGVGLGLLLLGANLIQVKSGWGTVAAIIGLIVLCTLVCGLLWHFSERFVFTGLPLIVLLSIGTWYFSNAGENERGKIDVERKAEDQKNKEKQELIEKIRQAHTSWTPGKGVQEFHFGGAVMGWLAVDPKLEIDTEYEAELGTKAKRLIPIRIVMLNNSYEDADLPLTENGSVWRLEVRDAAEQIVGQWQVDVGLGDHVLGPAERREFQIPWDGRTSGGDLVEPGRYVVSLQPEGSNASASTKAVIEIDDAGPIVTVQQSDFDRQLASNQETMRMLGDSMRMNQLVGNMISNLPVMGSR